MSEFSLAKGAKFQTTIHIGNDREEDEIEYLIVSQGKMIMSLRVRLFDHYILETLLEDMLEMKNFFREKNESSVRVEK